MVIIMNNTTTERREKAKKIISKHGLTIKEWAKRNDVSSNLVHAVISGKIAGNVNKGHKVAGLLGLKEGEIVE